MQLELNQINNSIIINNQLYNVISIQYFIRTENILKRVPV